MNPEEKNRNQKRLIALLSILLAFSVWMLVRASLGESIVVGRFGHWIVYKGG
ncbi:hypothetical protein [Mesorhizobium loti]|uniref:hypothetical protein n=1 Tax=Rhizobium loti TaxID=381 RepID=UPI0013787B9D|nr:hypothetical protein [Mesorhizobium loti]